MVTSTRSSPMPSSSSLRAAPMALHSPAKPAPRTRTRCITSDAFEDRGDALTDADAHRHQRIVTAGALQLARRSQRDTRPRGAERMTDRDRPAILIDPAVVERQFEPAQTGQDLGGKSLVDLDHVDVRKAEA